MVKFIWYSCSIFCLYLSTSQAPNVGTVSGKLTQIGSLLPCHYPNSTTNNVVFNIRYFEKAGKYQVSSYIGNACIGGKSHFLWW